MVLEVAESVFVDVRVVEPDLVLFDPGVSLGNLAATGPKRLDLSSVQHDARLENFKDMVIVPGRRIGQYVGHKQKQPEGRPFWLRKLQVSPRRSSCASSGRL